MASNILDPAALVDQLPSLLPSSNKTLTSSHDGIAALVHTAFTALGFRLVATDDVSPARSHPDNVLPDDWNTKGPVDRTLRYKHEQSSFEFLVKIIKLGQRTLINAIAVQNDKSASLDISTNDFTSPSFYPHDITQSSASPLVNGFISSNRVADLISQLKLKIIQKLIPSLNKEGYSEEVEGTSTHVAGPATNLPPARPRPITPPFPGDIPYGPRSYIPPDNPLEIGRRDLEPFGGQPFAPLPLFPPHGGDGMFVGPDHPIFGSRGRRSDVIRGPWGGDGFLPPLGAPPGARFDPITPLNRIYPPFGRGAPGRRSGEPDNDEFMPPGAGDMFM
ncbi:PI31 proteasome regulator N-terminal-domain-containing protein [Scleroderma yunnanense]